MSISSGKYSKMIVRQKINIGLSMIVALTFSISGCIESSFKLADESRIPSWFNVPSGLNRNDLDITLDYYTDGSAVFKLYRKGSLRILDEVTGVMRDETPLEKDGTTWPTGQMPNYPLYEVIIFQGDAQIIEHKKMEPVFYITDDPSIMGALGCSESVGDMYECREIEIIE